MNLSQGPADEHTSLNFFSGGMTLVVYVIIDLPYTQGVSSHFSYKSLFCFRFLCKTLNSVWGKILYSNIVFQQRGKNKEIY